MELHMIYLIFLESKKRGKLDNNSLSLSCYVGIV